MDLHSISLFSGVGMLDEGLRAGLAHLGISHRTLCQVEREAYGAAVLAARMEEGSMDAAPIWTNVLTFDARAWRGRVDCIVAGFPCQDLSVAGRRAGLDGARSGLFFEVVRIATDSGAWLMFLENVAGIASATASVVDATEGDLDERAAARVVGELADLGWDAEWVTLSASDVGASHRRARWFCLAWRHMDDARGIRADEGVHERRRQEGQGVSDDGRAGDAMADPGCRDVRRIEPQPVGGRSNPAGDHAGGAEVADPSTTGWRCAKGCDEPGERCVEEQGVAGCGECGWDAVGRPEIVGGVLADASGTRPQRRELGRARESHRGGREAHGPVSQLRGLFAPGPADPGWPGILAEHPELAPALEPSFRSMVDGLAFDMGDSRAARLKCVGNGVVALCAGFAFVGLARRANLFHAAFVKRTRPA